MSGASRRLIVATLTGLLVAAGLASSFAHRRASRLERDNARLRARLAELQLELLAARTPSTQGAAEEGALPLRPAASLHANPVLPSAEAPVEPEPAPREEAEPTPQVEELTPPLDPVQPPPVAPPPPAVSPEEAPLALSEVVRRGRGRVQVPLPEGGLTLELVHVEPGAGFVGLDLESLPPTERAARALLPAAGFSSPRVRVVLEEGFLIGAREVTNGQYLAVLAASGVDLAARRARRGYLSHLEQVAPGWEEEPVRGVSWDEAAEFCALLGRFLAAPVRLPSEVEWELAAAGLGDAPRRHPWGDSPAGDDVTPEGARDLGLSLHEWCLEPWDARRWSRAAVLLHRPSEVHPGEPAPSEAMTCRGGSLASRLQLQAECVWRQGRLASTRGRALGFRIAIPVE